MGKKIALILFAIVFAWSWINPPWPTEKALHDSLTVVGLIALWWFNRRYHFSVFAFNSVVFFIAMHTIGAHWLYSHVPYDNWLQHLFGATTRDLFGWQRNHYDRLIHLLYGVCLTPIIAEYARAKYRFRYRSSWLVALSAIMISSLMYEWFEWGVSLTLSPEDTESYNGQQGDMWDAHKDMLLATLGSLAWWIAYRKK